MDSKVFNRRFERNTVFANVCALTVDWFKTRCRANRHNLSLICVQLKLVAIHPEQNIINTCLNTGLKRKELIGWGTFGQLSIIGVFVIVTIMDRNHIWQRLRVQGKQYGSQLQGTLGHAVHKRAGGGHNTINNDWLKTATQETNQSRTVPLTQRLFQAVSAVSDGPKCRKQHLDQAEPPGKLVSHPRYQADHQGHSVWQSQCYGFACKRTERFQEDYCQTDGFSTDSGQLSQESLRWKTDLIRV